MARKRHTEARACVAASSALVEREWVEWLIGTCAHAPGIAVGYSHLAAVVEGKVHVMIREPLVPEHGVRSLVGGVGVVGMVENSFRERHLVDGVAGLE